MPARPEKDSKSISDLQEALAKRLQRDEAFSGLSFQLSEKAKEALRQSLRTPELEQVARAAAARVFEQSEQKRLESERLQAAIRWIEDKWGDQPCPYCQHTEWQVGTPLEISLSEGDVMSPAFPVMCGNCGHTTFVNAIKADLVSEPDEGEE